MNVFEQYDKIFIYFFYTYNDFMKGFMEKIKNAAAAFAAATEIPVTCFNTKGEIQWEYSADNRVCNHFKVYGETDGACLNNLLSSARIAAQIGEPYIFLCRAGLANIAFSLIIDKKVAGCLIAGPILMGELKESIFSNIISINRLSMDAYPKVIMALKNIKTVKPNDVSLLADLFGNCILGAITPNFDYMKISEHNQEMQKIAENLQKHKAEGKTAAYQGGSLMIKEAVGFINENYKEKISLRSIAKNLHISPSYLSMLFKQETGVTITEYVNIVRIGKSRQLLAETSMSILDIAAMSGFEDQSYFSKIFKRISEVTPKEYRSIAKEGLVVYHYKKETGG